MTCVNKALATLKANGTLAALQKKYLKDYLSPCPRSSPDVHRAPSVNRQATSVREPC